MATKCNVSGRIDDAAFQRAAATAGQLAASAARDVSCVVEVLTPFAWDVHRAAAVQAHGAAASSVGDAALVTIDGVIQPSVDSFVDWAKATHGVDTPDADYGAVAKEAASKFLANPERTFCFFDVTIGERPVGRLVFELFKSTCPKTCDNFVRLCAGADGKTAAGVSLTYKGSVFHRVQPGGWVQGGDIVSGAGDGGCSVFGDTFEDENYVVGHDARGVLSMANAGPHTNASQFSVSFRPLPWMNRKYVAFGRVYSGTDALTALETVETAPSGRPAVTCCVADCGVL